MNDTSNYDEVARRYGLAPMPESVTRLAQLISRQDADLGEISAFIDKDPALKRKLLQLSNPGEDNESEYTIRTVSAALMRNGIGCAFLLGMATPLSEALIKTFRTMLLLKLESIDIHDAPGLKGEHLIGSIVFSGKAGGQAYLRLSYNSAREIAARVLQLEPGQMPGLDDTQDAVGEVLNIMTGNFKSNLSDAGLDCCRLEPPQVTMTSEFKTVVAPGCGLERMAFRAGSILLFVEALVNPWN